MDLGCLAKKCRAEGMHRERVPLVVRIEDVKGKKLEREHRDAHGAGLQGTGSRGGGD